MGVMFSYFMVSLEGQCTVWSRSVGAGCEVGGGV